MNVKTRFSLQDRTTLVTGASKGLGQAIALRFAEAGADVILVSHHDRIELEETAHQITGLGRRALPILADISNADDVERIFRAASSEFEQLHVLMNNAGYSAKQSWGPDITQLSLEDFDRTLQVDVRGTFLMCKNAYPWLAQESGSNVINITSGAAIMGDPIVLLYAAAKAGVHGLTKALATAWAPKVRVNGIAPGAIRTGWIQSWNVPDSDIQAIESQIPLKRLGLPYEIADTALFLASDSSAYVTGQTIVVDGGFLRT